MQACRSIAIQGDPAEGQHGEELHGHDPVNIVGGDERGETEEEGLHEDGEDELVIHVFDIVDKTWNYDASDELAGTIGVLAKIP